MPILLVDSPSLASFTTRASTSSGSYLHQEGDLLLTGRTECDLPFSCLGNTSVSEGSFYHTMQIFKTSEPMNFPKTIQRISGKQQIDVINDSFAPSQFQQRFS